MRLKVGNGLEDGVQVGPLIDDAAVEKVERHVADATAGGAELVRGGNRLEGTFFEPTVLTGVTSAMAMSCEETFGPVAGIQRFASEQEAVGLANDTPYGLAAYFYSRDLGRVWRVSEALEYGILGVNTGFISTEVAPFGGMKESGIGREGSKYGVEDWLELKYVCMGTMTSLSLYEDLLSPDEKLALPAGGRIVYVASGELAGLHAGRAAFGADESTISAGSDGATVLRWELTEWSADDAKLSPTSSSIPGRTTRCAASSTAAPRPGPGSAVCSAASSRSTARSCSRSALSSSLPRSPAAARSCASCSSAPRTRTAMRSPRARCTYDLRLPLAASSCSRWRSPAAARRTEPRTPVRRSPRP